MQEVAHNTCPYRSRRTQAPPFHAGAANDSDLCWRKVAAEHAEASRRSVGAVHMRRAAGDEVGAEERRQGGNVLQHAA